MDRHHIDTQSRLRAAFERAAADQQAITDSLVKFTLQPRPWQFERADTHARLIISLAEAQLIKIIEAAASNSNEIDGAALIREVKAYCHDMAGEISGAFGLESDPAQ